MNMEADTRPAKRRKYAGLPLPKPNTAGQQLTSNALLQQSNVQVESSRESESALPWASTASKTCKLHRQLLKSLTKLYKIEYWGLLEELQGLHQQHVEENAKKDSSGSNAGHSGRGRIDINKLPTLRDQLGRSASDRPAQRNFGVGIGSTTSKLTGGKLLASIFPSTPESAGTIAAEKSAQVPQFGHSAPSGSLHTDGNPAPPSSSAMKAAVTGLAVALSARPMEQSRHTTPGLPSGLEQLRSDLLSPLLPPLTTNHPAATALPTPAATQHASADEAEKMEVDVVGNVDVLVACPCDANMSVSRPGNADISISRPAHADLLQSRPCSNDVSVARPSNADVPVARPGNADVSLSSLCNADMSVARSSNANGSVLTAGIADASIFKAPSRAVGSAPGSSSGTGTRTGPGGPAHLVKSQLQSPPASAPQHGHSTEIGPEQGRKTRQEESNQSQQERSTETQEEPSAVQVVGLSGALPDAAAAPAVPRGLDLSNLYNTGRMAMLGDASKTSDMAPNGQSNAQRENGKHDSTKHMVKMHWDEVMKSGTAEVVALPKQDQSADTEAAVKLPSQGDEERGREQTPNMATGSGADGQGKSAEGEHGDSKQVATDTAAPGRCVAMEPNTASVGCTPAALASKEVNKSGPPALSFHSSPNVATEQQAAGLLLAGPKPERREEQVVPLLPADVTGEDGSPDRTSEYARMQEGAKEEGHEDAKAGGSREEGMKQDGVMAAEGKAGPGRGNGTAGESMAAGARDQQGQQGEEMDTEGTSCPPAGTFCTLALGMAAANHAPAVGLEAVQALVSAHGDDVRGYGSDDEPAMYSDVEEHILEGNSSGTQVFPLLSQWRHKFAELFDEVVRLEQLAAHAIALDMDSKDALAYLLGRAGRYLIKRSTVSLGRCSDHTGAVDVDLSLEGQATKVSRQQADITCEADGTFQITNLGRRYMHVNNTLLQPGEGCHLLHLSLIEVGGVRLLFFVNHNATARISRRSANMSM